MKKHLKEWAEAVLQAAGILLLLFLFCWPVNVDGQSMENTLTHGDRILISRVLAWTDSVEKGDLVIAKMARNGRQELVVKRLAAREGDKIRIADGFLWINDILMEEPYAAGPTNGEFEGVVPEGCYFLLGDNRTQSIDSRHAGYIHKEELTGKVIVKWYPFHEMKIY